MDSSVKGRSEILFQLICNVVMIFLALAAILPFILLFMSSITDEKALLLDGYSFFPKELSTYAYEYLFISNRSNILRAYGNTFIVTFAGTILSLLIAPLLAWPLARKDYPRKKYISFFVFFTMLFNGGLVPNYIMWTQVFHIKNTIASLIFPTLLMNGFIIMLLRSNYSQNIHPALIEAARIDGAGEITIYQKIVMPLSRPILATVGLMIALGYWNDWQNGLYYITDSKLYSLQLLLNNILKNIQTLATLSSSVSVVSDIPGTSIRMAMAVIGGIPIMLLYPFFQQYFVKGIALGGVKE